MAKKPQNISSTEGDPEDMQYYRSPVSALSVVVGDPDPTKGEVAHPTVDFVPYWEAQLGVEGPGPRKEVKVGFLKTNEGSAIRKLEGDANVQQIDREAYELATSTVFDDAGQQIGGLRAPY